MWWREAPPMTALTVACNRRTRRKQLEQGCNARLPETDDDSLQCGVVCYFLEWGAVPTRSIRENATVGGEYQSGPYSRVEHESVVLS